jgi:large subunit ribosomal protein L34e
LLQLPALRPKALSRLSKSQKNVTRAYGGSRCGKCVRDRILRAFLIEEQKIVKKVLKAQQVQQQTEQKKEKDLSKGKKKKNAAPKKK